VVLLADLPHRWVGNRPGFNAVNAYGPANRPLTEAEIQTELQHLNRR